MVNYLVRWCLCICLEPTIILTGCLLGKWARQLLCNGQFRFCLRVRGCCVEFHNGTVLGTQSLLSLVLRSWIGKLRSSSSPKSVPWCNSIEHRHSLKRSLRINSFRRDIGKREDFQEDVDPVNQAELERISHSPCQIL